MIRIWKTPSRDWAAVRLVALDRVLYTAFLTDYVPKTL